MKHIRITHPELGESKVVPSSLHVWLARGWAHVDALPEDTSPAEVPSPTSEYSADEADSADESDVTSARNLRKSTQHAESRS